ncbi:MAG: hypothetical protein HC828_21975 [Blastochloris sp.]|nr:hypothetical protein [Blastochloris sp.]
MLPGSWYELPTRIDASLIAGESTTIRIVTATDGDYMPYHHFAYQGVLDDAPPADLPIVTTFQDGAIVLHAIDSLGYEAFLVSVVVAGVFQIGLGLLRAGIIAYYFPATVIRGMLAGIGALLQIKPIITVDDGVVNTMARVRTMSRAREELVEMARPAGTAGSASLCSTPTIWKGLSGCASRFRIFCLRKRIRLT